MAKRIRAGDQQSLDRLVEANLRFVVTVAKQYQNQGMSLGDLINEGNVGLLKAAKRFSETFGFKFVSYAVWWIRQAILNALAEQSRIVRLPMHRVGMLYTVGQLITQLGQKLERVPTDEEIAKASNLELTDVRIAKKIAPFHISLDAPLTDGNLSLIEQMATPDQAFWSAPENQRQFSEALGLALKSLTPREAEVIKLYFNLDGGGFRTLDEIGTCFSLTRERIRQIKEKALRRLRHESRAKYLRDFLDSDAC